MGDLDLQVVLVSSLDDDHDRRASVHTLYAEACPVVCSPTVLTISI